MRAALWAALTGALVAVPEHEPGWLWLAGHVISSVLVAYLVMCLIDVAWMRAVCALAPGSYAAGGVTITAWTEQPMPPGGEPNLAVLPRPIEANPRTWELLDAVDAYLADSEEKP